MALKRRIPAKEVVTDIRSGMSNSDLMDKYQLSMKGLMSVFTKLIEAEFCTKKELLFRMPPGDDTADLDEMRDIARCYPVVRLPVIDLGDLRSEGYVRDLTEKGIQVAGVRAKVGDKKNFLIQADSFAAILPFTLEAHCRWVRTDSKSGITLSGYEIAGISETNLESLRKAVGVFTFCDEKNEHL
ncbi:MAG: hypothetical protein HY913_09170 [Desulfomonile tiedjei]|nr:hypothetical protein [Desulfomonile tiedjei]